MKSVLGFLKSYKKEMGILMPLYAVSTAAGLFMPFLMSEIVNKGIAQKDMNAIITQGIIMLALALVTVITAIITVKINAKVSSGFVSDLFRGIFKKVNTFTMDEFLKIGTSSLLTRSTHDVYVMYEFVSNLIFVIINIPILFIGGIVLSLIKDYALALILLSAAPLIIFIVWLIARRMGKLWDRADKYIDDQNKIVRERLSGIRVIRAFDREDYEHNRMAEATKKMASNIIRANTLSGSILPVLVFLFNLAMIVVLYVGSFRLMAGTALTAGDILATVQYVSLVMYGCSILTFGLIFLPQIKVSAKRIHELLTMPGDAVSVTENERLAGDIVFDKVTFTYPGSSLPALENISFHIKNGETVAIIGGTGSGKTTLTRLMLLFYRATSGDIYLGGKNYNDLTRETARDNISIVLQKGMIFQSSIAENIMLGNPAANEEALKRASENAQIASFIESLEDKYEHKLSESGTNISGGQKQRITIARALIKDASVYIFDDSFSNLDFITEAKLRKALKKELKGKTQIIITQRAATAMHCDRIFVLNNGRLDGAGTHTELLKSSEIYREICKSQMG